MQLNGRFHEKKAKASYTVEAALIFPLLLFILLGGVKIGVELHGTVKQEAQEYENVREIDAVEEIKHIKQLEILVGDS